MPRNYKRKLGSNPYSNYTAENVEKALKEIKSGKSIRKVAKEFKIPRETLRRTNKSGKSLKSYGRPTALSIEEERTLVEKINIACEWGYPLDCNDMKEWVKQYLSYTKKDVKTFKNNTPGTDWCYSFAKRHNLSLRYALNIKSQYLKLQY